MYKKKEITESIFFAHFDDGYWVMFPKAKSMFFPNFMEKIPNSRFKKMTTILWHLNCTQCTVPQKIVFLHSKFWNVLICVQNFWFYVPLYYHTGQCKRTGGCYNELVVAFFSTSGGVKGKKIYTCWLFYLFINLHLFYLWWHLAHRPPVTLQFMALPSNWWYNSWFGLQIQHSSEVLPWRVLFSSVTA